MPRVADRLLRAVMRRAARVAGLRVYRVMVRELPADASEEEPGRKSGGEETADLLALKPLDLVPYCADPALELDEGTLRAAQARGESIVAAFRGATLAGYLWCAVGPAPHTGNAWAGVPLGTAYLYRAYVRPDFRGRGIATALFRRARGAFLPKACSRTLACVELHNRASMAAMRAAGFAPRGYVGTLQAGSRMGLWRSAAAAATGFRFSTLQDGRSGLSRSFG